MTTTRGQRRYPGLPQVSDDCEPDPIWVTSLHEARFIMAMWVIGMLWAVGVSAWLAYRPLPADGVVPMVFGFPSWIFWAIVTPWVVSNAVTIWYCLTRMQDGDLEIGSMPDADTTDSSATE